MLSAASSTFTDRAHHAHDLHGLPRTAGALLVKRRGQAVYCGKRVLPAAPEDAIVCPRERRSTEVVEESRGFGYLVNLLFLRFSAPGHAVCCVQRSVRCSVRGFSAGLDTRVGRADHACVVAFTSVLRLTIRTVQLIKSNSKYFDKAAIAAW